MLYLSDILQTDFLNQAKYHLPLSKRDETSIKIWIKNAISRYSKIYIDNNKGVYDVTEQYDFYNVANEQVNVRGLDTDEETRWCVLAPVNLYLNKLTSCMLQAIIPADVILPTNVEYIQDMPVTIVDSRVVNVTTPTANSGAVALLGGRKLMSALTLDNTGSRFADIAQITALYTGYRNPVYPDWSEDSSYRMDILVKDVELICNYIVQEAYLPNKAPIGVEQRIQDAEYQIIYGS